MTLRVAIAGRPNVGKSTLFNRLAGRRLALVHDEPGVTRDRREAEAGLGELRFTVVDTAGLDESPEDSLQARMRRQTEIALATADVILFLIDARAGLTPLDRRFADLVRRQGKPVLVLANKVENPTSRADALEGHALGLGDPVAISAEHGEGMSDLYGFLRPHVESHDRSVERSDGEDGELGPDRPLRLAVIGRPNVGKSTLINRMLGDDRLLTGPEAGITRDSISVDWSYEGLPVKLFDTAGIRRKARIREKLEKLSVADGLRAIRFAEVVVLLIDAETPFEKQDLQLADLAAREGRAVIVAANKWDLVKRGRKTLDDLREAAERLLPQLRGVAVVPLSAKTGRGLNELMPAVLKVHEAWNRRISTGRLNRWLEETVRRHLPPAPRGRRLKLRYVTQAKARPPSFVGFCQRADDMPASYLRYLVNGLREDFGLWGTPVRFSLRKGRNPYAER